jgi:hypothetical protein
VYSSTDRGKLSTLRRSAFVQPYFIRNQLGIDISYHIESTSGQSALEPQRECVVPASGELVPFNSALQSPNDATQHDQWWGNQLWHDWQEQQASQQAIGPKQQVKLALSIAGYRTVSHLPYNRVGRSAFMLPMLMPIPMLTVWCLLLATPNLRD